MKRAAAIIAGWVMAWALSVGTIHGQANFPAAWVDNSIGTTTNSGAPEAFSPVTALATCHTNGASSTTIQWPSHGITGLSVTGDALVRLGTPSGRRYSVVTAVPNDNTLTVADNFNIAAVSAVDCGVGGRLLNITPELSEDMKGATGSFDGWEVHLVETGVNYVWTAARVSFIFTSGAGYYGEKTGSTRPIVECTFQPGTCLQTNITDIKSIEFRNTNVTKTGTIGLRLGDFVTAQDNIIGGPSAALAFEEGLGAFTGQRPSIVSNLIRNNVRGYDASGAGDTLVKVLANVFRGNTDGIFFDTTGDANHLIMGNVFWENVDGIHSDLDRYDGFNIWLLNTFDSNTANGVNITDPAGISSLLFSSNLLTSNLVGGTYSGAPRNQAREAAQIDFNCYGIGAAANVTATSGLIRGPNTISIDPEYADTATGDFTPTTQDVLFRAWPPGLDGGTPRNYVGTATPSEIVCGAIQPSDSGGISSVGF